MHFPVFKSALVEKKFNHMLGHWSQFSFHTSHCIGTPTIWICKNKDTDQLCSNCTADQHLCFRFTDSMRPLLSKFEISSFFLFSMTALTCIVTYCDRSGPKTPTTSFPTRRLISNDQSRLTKVQTVRHVGLVLLFFFPIGISLILLFFVFVFSPT